MTGEKELLMGSMQIESTCCKRVYLRLGIFEKDDIVSPTKKKNLDAE